MYVCMYVSIIMHQQQQRRGRSEATVCALARWLARIIIIVMIKYPFSYYTLHAKERSRRKKRKERECRRHYTIDRRLVRVCVCLSLCPTTEINTTTHFCACCCCCNACTTLHQPVYTQMQQQYN